MKRYLILIFLLIFMSIVNAANVEKQIERELTKNNEVEVIVYLKEQQGTSKYVNYEYVEENIREKSIKSLKNDFELEHEYGSLNGFAGNITEDGLEKLKNNLNVESIYLSKTRTIFLPDSLSLMNATLVHNKLINNLNLTGKGQTICILDTGINYSHNDLGGCFGDGCRVISGYDYVNDNNDPYDDNGHGTHVAGIAAANGNIKGVAPEANLTIIKVCNSGGTCADADIIAGIDWCNNNRTKFNINVISMSLGDNSLNSIYCNMDNLAPAINSAVLNNITVVIATGNSGNSSGIAAPACVENATSVASSTKQDAISNFSNRNSITDVIAPGENINSTYYNGRYAQFSGTSMATPHIAGIVALLEQYKQQESNRILTVNEVEAALKSSNKNITDSNGLNYTRVNANKALISIDTKKPYFNILINPNPTNISNNVNINFSAIDTNLDTILVNVTYPNGTLLALSSNNFTLSSTNLNVAGRYNITFYANDSNGNANQTTLALIVNNPNLPILTLNSPVNNLNTSSNLIDFNCSATANSSLANLTLYINIAGNFTANQSKNVSGLNNSTNFTLNLDDNNYIWNCLAYDNSGNQDFASNNFTLTIDTLKPIITNINPSSITPNSALITWITNEIANSTVYYGTSIATNLMQQDNSFITSHSISLSSLDANTLYYYNVSSCDLVNNCNTSMQFNFTTTSSNSGSGGISGGSSSGGGGGSSSNQVTQPINPLPPLDINSNISENTQKIINNKENKTIQNNSANISNEIKRENPSLIKKLLNIITGKNTLTGKVIVNADQRATYIAGLITMLAIIALVVYKVFFKPAPP